MKTTSDLEVNCAVRRVLVRHHVDLQKIAYRTIRGKVAIWGEMVPEKAAASGLNSSQALAILEEIRRVEGVRRVVPSLNNLGKPTQPAQPAQPVQAHTAPAATQHGRCASKNVLAIDDDASILDMLKCLLSEKGYSVFTSSNTDEVSLILENNNISLVLLDVLMPKKHGFTLYREFVAHKQIPVLFVTGATTSFSGDSQELLELWNNQFTAGTTDILYKPFSAAVLCEKVESLIGPGTAEPISSPSAPELNHSVRKILLKHWVDLGRISMRTENGVVRLLGVIGRLSRAGLELGEQAVLAILNEIRGIPDVRDVVVKPNDLTSLKPE